MCKKFSMTVFFCLLAGSVSAAENKPLADEADRINYSIGHQIGSDFKRQKVEIDEQALRQGLQHGQANKKPLLATGEMNSMLVELKRNITDRMKKESVERINNRRAVENKKRREGEAFLEKNGTLEGVKSMPSGLQYKVIKEGKGDKPTINDFVTFNYRARRMDGVEYDSSFKKGGPVTYRSNGVLPGFTEAVQLMKTGAKWDIYIPPELAYGRHGLLAHQTIFLEVELLSIGKPEQK